MMREMVSIAILCLALEFVVVHTEMAVTRSCKAVTLVTLVCFFSDSSSSMALLRCCPLLSVSVTFYRTMTFQVSAFTILAGLSHNQVYFFDNLRHAANEVTLERRYCTRGSDAAHFVGWHNVEYHTITLRRRSQLYVTVRSWWSEYESSRLI